MQAFNGKKLTFEYQFKKKISILYVSFSNVSQFFKRISVKYRVSLIEERIKFGI